MNIKELEDYLRTMPDELMGDTAEIVAETATEYFKETFRKKAFDGNPWAPARTAKKRGSLLIDSGGYDEQHSPASCIAAACGYCCGQPEGNVC